MLKNVTGLLLQRFAIKCFKRFGYASEQVLVQFYDCYQHLLSIESDHLYSVKKKIANALLTLIAQ